MPNVSNERGLVSRVRASVLDFWSNHPAADLAMAGMVVGGHVLLVYHFKHGNILSWADQQQRLAIYAAGAGIMSLIAGFAGNGITQYGGASSRLIAQIRRRYGATLRKNWVSIISWLLTCAILCIFAMAVDSKEGPRASEWVFEVALCVAVVKFARLVFLFSLILKSLDADLVGGGVTRKSNPAWRPGASRDEYRSAPKA